MNDDPVYDLGSTATLIALALEEDLGARGDATCQALVPPRAQLEATITAKADGVVCGLPLVRRVLRAVATRIGATEEIVCSHCIADGTAVTAGTMVWRGRGLAHVLLAGERTALNLAQRLSGTSTLAARYRAAIAGTSAGIFDTRKTTPGLRLLQKHAVRMGGGDNHRLGLYDQILIKDNHIALMLAQTPGAAPPASAPAEAVRRCRAAVGPGVVIEVEIERLEDLEPVMRAGADLVLLDNMEVPTLADAVRQRDALVARGLPRVALEASGGITLATVRAVALTGVERISTGELTHSAPALDLSMRCRTVA